MKVRYIMTRNVTCVSPGDSLRDAYDLMQGGEVRHLPVVVENNHLVGLLSERDVLLRASFEGGRVNVPDMEVGTVMTTDLVTCKPKHQMRDVAEIMLERRIDSMPVTDETGELMGIITSADFLELAAQRQQNDLAGYKSVPFNFTINRFRPEARLAETARSSGSQVYDADAI